MGKSHNTLKLTSILAICFIAHGCVGIAVFRTKTETLDPPAIEGEAAFHNVWEYGGKRNIPHITDAILRASWGEPASIKPSSAICQDELWTYKFGRIWCGIVPCLVVPVPLLLPTGRERVIFFVRKGQVTKAEVVRSGSFGAVFFFLSAEGPFKCAAGSD